MSGDRCVRPPDCGERPYLGFGKAFDDFPWCVAEGDAANC